MVSPSRRVCCLLTPGSSIIERIGAYRMTTPNVLGLRAAIASYQDEACMAFSKKKREMASRNILVGRPFPPFLDWCRVSVGHEEDMKQFIVAFEDLLASKS